MIGNSVIMELIADGVLWHYESYDHKAAVEELMQMGMNVHISGAATAPRPDYSYYTVPDQMKLKHADMKVGKLRTMKFDPDGMIAKMYVGRSFKYAKAFFPQEIGTERIKPILNINCDKYNLIQAGLAVDENQLEV